jgi:hypothetical protein
MLGGFNSKSKAYIYNAFGEIITTRNDFGEKLN